MNPVTKAFTVQTAADAYFSVPFAKVLDHDDGTVTVFGRPTSETLDVDGQIVDRAFMKKALPKWFTEWGNIREMHQAKAIGKAKDLQWDGDDPWLTAHIVDSEAVKKVRAGVLQAFSIGVNHPRYRADPNAPRGRMVDGEVLEVSAVDRPSDPDARFQIVKAAGPNAWLDCQTGETVKIAGMAGGDANWDATRSGELDALGNPILQPGHVQSNAASISVVTMDDRGIVFQMGADQWVVPYTVDLSGHYEFGTPRLLPINPRATPDDPREDLPVSEGGVKMAEPSATKRDEDPDVGGGVDRDKLSADDFVDPKRRRFPIVEPKDVHDAVSTFGLAKPPIPLAHFKERLEAIARRKGAAFVAALPKEWTDEKGATKMADPARVLLDAAQTALQSQAYCATCRKTVTLAAVKIDKAAVGGRDVTYEAVCGHLVRKFVAKAAEEDKAAHCDTCDKAVPFASHSEDHTECKGVCGHAMKCDMQDDATKSADEKIPTGQGDAAEPGGHTGEGQPIDERIEKQERDIGARMRKAVEDYLKANTGEGGAEEGAENRALSQLKELVNAAVSQQEREAVESGDVGAKDNADDKGPADADKTAVQKAAMVLIEGGYLDAASRLLADVGKSGRKIKRDRLDRLKEHHAKLGDLIGELDDADKDEDKETATKAVNNDGAAPLVTRSQIVERIREALGEIDRLAHLVGGTEGELFHEDGEAGNLGPTNKPVAPSKKPTGAGTWDMQKNDGSGAAMRDAGEDTQAMYKAAIAETIQALLPAVGKSVGDQLAAVLDPLTHRVEQLAHQPMNVTRADLYVAERPEEFGMNRAAMSKAAEARAQFTQMTPDDQRKFASQMLAEARRAQGAR